MAVYTRGDQHALYIILFIRHCSDVYNLLVALTRVLPLLVIKQKIYIYIVHSFTVYVAVVGEYNDFLSFPDDDEQVLLKSSFSGLRLADDVYKYNNIQNKNTCIHRRVTDKKK